MSGALSPQLAQAAGTIALRAEAAARGLTLGRLIQARLVESLRQREPGESLPGRAWREIPLRTRALLLQEAADIQGDPREAARKPWDALDEATRDRVGALARALRRELASAAQLF